MSFKLCCSSRSTTEFMCAPVYASVCLCVPASARRACRVPDVARYHGMVFMEQVYDKLRSQVCQSQREVEKSRQVERSRQVETGRETHTHILTLTYSHTHTHTHTHTQTLVCLFRHPSPLCSPLQSEKHGRLVDKFVVVQDMTGWSMRSMHKSLINMVMEVSTSAVSRAEPAGCVRACVRACVCVCVCVC